MRTLAMTLTALSLAVAAPAAAQETETKEPAAAAVEEDDWRVTAGVVFVGVGVAAIVAGATLGTVAAAQYADLDCPNDRCAPEIFADAEDYNALRVPSGLTIAFGGLLSAVGGAFLYAALTEPDDAVSVDVGAGTLHVKVRF